MFQKHKSDHASSLLTILHGFSGHLEENLEFLPLPSDALNDLAPDFCFNTVSLPLHHARYDMSVTATPPGLRDAHVNLPVGTLHLFLSPPHISHYHDFCIQAPVYHLNFQLSWHPLIIILILCVLVH